MLFIKNKDKTTLQDNIDTAFTQLFSLSAGTDEYDRVLDEIDRLHKLKNLNKGFAISPDTLVTVGGSLLGIILILNYEKIGVMASKATGFVIKPH